MISQMNKAQVDWKDEEEHFDQILANYKSLEGNADLGDVIDIETLNSEQKRAYLTLINQERIYEESVIS